MPIKGIINFSHLSYVTSTIAREAKINPAGVIKEISPSPYAYAETIAALDTPTVSASGAMIGTDNTASPEEDEMKNPSTNKYKHHQNNKDDRVHTADGA